MAKKKMLKGKCEDYCKGFEHGVRFANAMSKYISMRDEIEREGKKAVKSIKKQGISWI